MPLVASVSGIRGTVPDSLNSAIIEHFVGSFCQLQPAGPIVLGRDGRPSGSTITDEVIEVLTRLGRDVFEVGVVPTPTVQMEILRRHAAGGIAISASHNPAEWNGLKFLDASSLFLAPDRASQLIALAGTRPTLPSAGQRGSVTTVTDAIDHHISEILATPFIDANRIRARGLRVVVDAVNAAGSVAVPSLLRALGCTVIPLYCDGSGVFPHTPEPLPENLGDLCAAVKTHGADLGVAVDPDSDRLVLITEQGIPFGEEYTIVECVDAVLKQRPGTPVAINLSTTRAVIDVAARYGSETARTPVGEINVALAMQERGALIGGEGSGGVILAPLHLGRDALAGCALTLFNLAATGLAASALRASYPSYAMLKHKFTVASASEAARRLEAIATTFSGESVRRDDGVHVTFKNGNWLHARSSNTEPIVRIIAEADSPAEASRLVNEAINA